MNNVYNPDPEQQAQITRSRQEWYAQERAEAAIRREQWLNRREEKLKPVTEAEIMAIASGQKQAQDFLRKLRGEDGST